MFSPNPVIALKQDHWNQELEHLHPAGIQVGTWAHKQTLMSAGNMHNSALCLQPTPAQSSLLLSGICQMFLHNHSKYLICGSQVFNHQLSASSHEGSVNHIAYPHVC